MALASEPQFFIEAAIIMSVQRYSQYRKKTGTGIRIHRDTCTITLHANCGGIGQYTVA